MKSRFTEDGDQRFAASAEVQGRLRELRKLVRTRHSRELTDAGFLRRIILHWLIFIEYRRERKHIMPSPYSVYMSESDRTHGR